MKDINNYVFDPLPLQQGLRPTTRQTDSVNVSVFDPLPLQQGLRHLQPELRSELWHCL